MRRTAALPVIAVAAALALAACGGSSSGGSTPSASASGSAASGPSKSTKVGVTVTGEAGKKPTLTIPKSAAPTTTSVEVLSPGTGDTVNKGDVLVADYLGQTWADKDGKPNVFDNSYDRGQPAGFAIGVGQVVKGWDSTLVGQKLGSRVLLTITPADGYGTEASAQNELGGQTLVFVVDLRSTVKGDGIASGDVQKLPAGFPAVTSASGKRPEVTSVKDVKTSAKGSSALLIKGTGAAVDESKQLVLQFLQTDAKTGKQTQKTWDAGQPQVVPASSVLQLVPVLKGQKIGSRAVAITPTEGGKEPAILVVDVIGQF